MSQSPDSQSKTNRTKARKQALAEAQARAAAARAAQLAKERRRRLLLRVGAPVLAVIVVVAVFLVIKLTSSKTSTADPSHTGPATPAPAALTSTLSSIPASTFDAVGAGDGVTGLQAITNGTALTDSGKPEVLYIGAEYCPYCAGLRWALVTSLDRFGTLSGLGITWSSATDSYADTPTLSLHGATFTSQYLSLVAKELTTNVPSGSSYAQLDTLDAAQSAIFQSITQGGVPMLDVGGKYAGSTPYIPDFLSGMTQQQVADQLKDPTTTVAKRVLGASNGISAAICASTNNQPAAVCTSAGVKAAAAALLK